MFSYFDSSALVRLYHDEPGTAFLDRLLESEDQVLIASRLTIVEVESAAAIKVRMGSLNPSGAEILRRRLRADIANGRVRVTTQIETEDYAMAQHLVRQYGPTVGLRSLDAFHLSIALRLYNTNAAKALVSADKRLCTAARAAGCPVIEVTAA